MRPAGVRVQLCAIPHVADPVQEGGSAEDDRNRKQDRETEVQLEVTPHVLKHCLREQGRPVTFTGLWQTFRVHCAVLSLFVLLWGQIQHVT